MKNQICLIICLTLLSLSSMNINAKTYSPVDSNVSYGSVTGLDFAKPEKKLVYGNANSDLQYGLLWLPDNLEATEKAPLIVLIHGGCWLSEYDIRHSFALSTALAEAGYAVWSLEYRRSGDVGGGWPGSFEDIRQGIAYTSELGDYPLELDRPVLMGHSAGGHLALLAATRDDSIHAVIGLAAITDIIEYSRGKNSCQTATLDFMSGTYEDMPSAYQAANPAGKTGSPNTRLLHGNQDVIVPLEHSHTPGATATVVDGAGHFDWVHPGTAAFQVLLSTLEDVFQQ